MFKYEHYPEDPHRLYHWFMPLEAGSPNLDAVAWCEERFGPRHSTPNGVRWWSNFLGRIFFREDDDAFEFRMRWC